MLPVANEVQCAVADSHARSEIRRSRIQAEQLSSTAKTQLYVKVRLLW